MTRKRSSPLGLEVLVCITLAVLMLPLLTEAAPLQEYTEIQQYSEGCYYNYAHYNEGDRIMTNEPCLNCTCHNRMLMCYLRVCPFTKPIGHDCIVEKREDQCCPIITCPEVPVDVPYHTPEPGTELSIPEKFGCSIEEKFYPEGAQVPSNPNKPCELCYCINNQTKCVMQECTLHVDGCTPIYNKGSCCPVRYSCDHENDVLELEDHSTTTTVRPTPGFILTTTMTPAVSTDCVHNGETYADGASLSGKNACEHCYCMRGDIVCAVQECEIPMMAGSGKSCHAMPAAEGECCPSNYVCDDESATTEIIETPTTADISRVGVLEDEITTTAPVKDIHGEIPKEDMALQEHIDDEEKLKEPEKVHPTDTPLAETDSGETITAKPDQEPSTIASDSRIDASPEASTEAASGEADISKPSTPAAAAVDDKDASRTTTPKAEQEIDDEHIAKTTTPKATETSDEDDIVKGTTPESVEGSGEEDVVKATTPKPVESSGEEDVGKATTPKAIEGSGEEDVVKETTPKSVDSSSEEDAVRTTTPKAIEESSVEDVVNETTHKAIESTSEEDMVQATTPKAIEGSGEEDVKATTPEASTASDEDEIIKATTPKAIESGFEKDIVKATTPKASEEEDINKATTSAEEGSGEEDVAKPTEPTGSQDGEEDIVKATTHIPAHDEIDKITTEKVIKESDEDEITKTTTPKAIDNSSEDDIVKATTPSAIKESDEDVVKETTPKAIDSTSEEDIVKATTPKAVEGSGEDKIVKVTTPETSTDSGEDEIVKVTTPEASSESGEDEIVMATTPKSTESDFEKDIVIATTPKASDGEDIDKATTSAEEGSGEEETIKITTPKTSQDVDQDDINKPTTIQPGHGETIKATTPKAIEEESDEDVDKVTTPKTVSEDDISAATESAEEGSGEESIRATTPKAAIDTTTSKALVEAIEGDITKETTSKPTESDEDIGKSTTLKPSQVTVEGEDNIKPTTPKAADSSDEEDIVKATTSQPIEDIDEKDIIRGTTPETIDGSGEDISKPTTPKASEESDDKDIVKATTVKADEDSSAEDISKATTPKAPEDSDDKDISKATTVKADEDSSAEDESKATTLKAPQDIDDKDVVKATTVRADKDSSEEDISKVTTPKTPKDSDEEDIVEATTAKTDEDSSDEHIPKATTPKGIEDSEEVDDSTEEKNVSPTTPKADEFESSTAEQDVHKDKDIETTTLAPQTVSSTERIAGQDASEAPERESNKDDSTTIASIPKDEDKSDESTRLPEDSLEATTIGAPSTQKTEDKIEGETSTAASKKETVSSTATTIPYETTDDKETSSTQKAPTKSDTTAAIGEVDENTTKPTEDVGASTDKHPEMPPSGVLPDSTERVDSTTELPEDSDEIKKSHPGTLPEKTETTGADEEKTTVAPSSEETSSEALPDMQLPSAIPGEGDCLVDGKTYGNNSIVPASTPCDISCSCISSIVACKQKECSPPKDKNSCVRSSEWDPTETCCPTYICDTDSTTTKIEQSDDQDTITTVKPQPSEIPADKIDEDTLGGTSTEIMPEDVNMPSGFTEQPLSHVKPIEEIPMHDLVESTTQTSKKPSTEKEENLLPTTVLPNIVKEEQKPSESDSKKQAEDEIQPSEHKPTTSRPMASDDKTESDEELSVTPAKQDEKTTEPKGQSAEDKLDTEPEDKISVTTHPSTSIEESSEVSNEIASSTDKLASSPVDKAPTTIKPSEVDSDELATITTVAPISTDDSKQPSTDKATSAEVDESTDDAKIAATVSPLEDKTTKKPLQEEPSTVPAKQPVEDFTTTQAPLPEDAQFTTSPPSIEQNSGDKSGTIPSEKEPESTTTQSPSIKEEHKIPSDDELDVTTVLPSVQKLSTTDKTDTDTQQATSSSPTDAGKDEQTGATNVPYLDKDQELPEDKSETTTIEPVKQPSTEPSSLAPSTEDKTFKPIQSSTEAAPETEVETSTARPAIASSPSTEDIEKEENDEFDITTMAVPSKHEERDHSTEKAPSEVDLEHDLDNKISTTTGIPSEEKPHKASTVDSEVLSITTAIPATQDDAKEPHEEKAPIPDSTEKDIDMDAQVTTTVRPTSAKESDEQPTATVASPTDEHEGLPEDNLAFTTIAPVSEEKQKPSDDKIKTEQKLGFEPEDKYATTISPVAEDASTESSDETVEKKPDEKPATPSIQLPIEPSASTTEYPTSGVFESDKFTTIPPTSEDDIKKQSDEKTPALSAEVDESSEESPATTTTRPYDEKDKAKEQTSSTTYPTTTPVWDVEEKTTKPTESKDVFTTKPPIFEDSSEESGEATPAPSVNEIDSEEDNKSQATTVQPSEEDAKIPAVLSEDKIKPTPEDTIDSTTIVTPSEDKKPSITSTPSKDELAEDNIDVTTMSSAEAASKEPTDDKVVATAPSVEDKAHDVPTPTEPSSTEKVATEEEIKKTPGDGATKVEPSVSGAQDDDTEDTTDKGLVDHTTIASISAEDVKKGIDESIAATTTPLPEHDKDKKVSPISETTESSTDSSAHVPADEKMDKKPMDEDLGGLPKEDEKTPIDDALSVTTPAADADKTQVTTSTSIAHDGDAPEKTATESSVDDSQVTTDAISGAKLQPSVPVVTESPVEEDDHVAHTIATDLKADVPSRATELPESEVTTTKPTTSVPAVVASLDETEDNEESVESEEERPDSEHTDDVDTSSESAESAESGETTTASTEKKQTSTETHDEVEIPAVISEIPTITSTAAPESHNETTSEVSSETNEDKDAATEHDIINITTMYPLFAQHFTTTTKKSIAEDKISEDEETTTVAPAKQSPTRSTTETPLTTTAASSPHYDPITPPSYGQQPQYPSYPEDEYDEEEVFGPGTCRYAGKLYVSAQQIPRDDPCDFCFCFRSDIICLQQSCPPPIAGCHEEPISGFCCPRYECPVSMAAVLNITTSTTTTSTTLPPHFMNYSHGEAVKRTGCLINGRSYKVGEDIKSTSGPCIRCTCGGDGNMKCNPQHCAPDPIMQEVMAAVVSGRQR